MSNSGSYVGGGFKSPIHGATIVDGTITAQKFFTDLQSDNYVAGTSGWFINRALGNVEFNDGVFRGTVTVTGGTVDWQYVDTTTNKVADGDISDVDFGKVDTSVNPVTDGDISDVGIGKLASGNLGATATIIGGGWIASDNYNPGVAGFKIDDTTAEFNNGVFRGTVTVTGGTVDWQYVDTTTNKIADGDISDVSVGTLTGGTMSINTVIGGGYIESSNFVTGALGDGWRIDSTGAELNNVVVRGTVYASAGEFTGTVTATAGELGNLDITGTLEMQSGAKILTAPDTGVHIEMSSGAYSNSLRFHTNAVAGEYSPGAISVTDWGASYGPTLTVFAPRSDSIDVGTSLILASKDFADGVGTGYGVSLTSGAGDAVISATRSGDKLQMFAHSNIEMTTTGTGEVFLNPNGDVRFSPGGKSHFDDGDVQIDNDLFTQKVHTGGTAWTQEPWSSSTIELGDYGSIGTQGSYGTYLTWNWERGTDSAYHHKNVNSYNEAGYIGIKNDGIHMGFSLTYNTTHTTVPPRLFRFDTDNVGQSRMYGNNDAEWFEIDHDNGWFQFFVASQEQLRIDDAGSSSALWINDGLTNVGNHEVLRLDRGSGTIMRAVGYYSSYAKDPKTGATLKRRIVPLRKRNNHWRREWFMDIEPVKYDRVQPKNATQNRTRKDGYVQRELGFTIENLIKHTNLLTTKGNAVGDSPDELALLAVIVDKLQDVERRLQAVETSTTMGIAA